MACKSCHGGTSNAVGLQGKSTKVDWGTVSLNTGCPTQRLVDTALLRLPWTCLHTVCLPATVNTFASIPDLEALEALESRCLLSKFISSQDKHSFAVSVANLA